MTHRLSCSAAPGILQDQGSDPRDPKYRHGLPFRTGSADGWRINGTLTRFISQGLIVSSLATQGINGEEFISSWQGPPVPSVCRGVRTILVRRAKEKLLKLLPLPPGSNSEARVQVRRKGRYWCPHQRPKGCSQEVATLSLLNLFIRPLKKSDGLRQVTKICCKLNQVIDSAKPSGAISLLE